jgi:hypothetical protein
VLEVLQKVDPLEKVIVISADNTNMNFGGNKRKGKNNLYYKLQEKNIKQLDWYGCPAYVVHNIVQTAVSAVKLIILSPFLYV